MYEECPAKLKIERVILKDGFFDETIHICKVINCDPEKETIWLLTGKTELPVFSLDALYTCSLEQEEESVSCGGRERKLPGTDPGAVLEQAWPCDRIPYSEWIL